MPKRGDKFEVTGNVLACHPVGKHGLRKGAVVTYLGKGGYKSYHTESCDGENWFILPEHLAPYVKTGKIARKHNEIFNQKGKKGTQKMEYKFKVGDHVKVSDKCIFFGDYKAQEWAQDGFKIEKIHDSVINNDSVDSLGARFAETMFGNYCYVSETLKKRFRENDLEICKPKPTLMDTLILPDEHLQSIHQAIAQTRGDINEKIFKTWGFGKLLEKGKGCHMLFYGVPGTGKTLAAEAIAEHLKRKMRLVGPAEIESSEPGGAERALKAFFAEATKNNLVLVFDECDSLIYDRQHIGMILAAQVNCLLGEMERFEGVCIYTTNNTPFLDPAFERRLSLKLDFPMPKKAHRLKIWERMFSVPQCLSPEVDLNEFAEHQMAGGSIKNIVLNAARRAAFMGKDKIDTEDLRFAFEREKEGRQAFLNRPKFNTARMKVDYGVSTGKEMVKEQVFEERIQEEEKDGNA